MNTLILDQRTIQFLSNKMTGLNNILLTQAKIDAFEVGFSLILFTISTAILVRIMYKKHKSFDYEYDDFSDLVCENPLLSAFCGVSIVVFVILFFAGGSEIIDCVFNPQYYELKELLNK
jgi:hypothetical protein